MAQKTTKDWFKTIAKNRGASWRKNLTQGRIDAALNPSNVAIVRRSQKMRQVELAKLVKLEPSTLGAIERGHRPATVITAKKIAQVLNVPVTKLFKPEGKKFVVIIKEQSI